MKTIKTAIFGTGFMGRVHLEAVRRVESVQAVAIAGTKRGGCKTTWSGFSIANVTTDYETFFEIPASMRFTSARRMLSTFPWPRLRLARASMCCARSRWLPPWPKREELVALAERQGLRNCMCHNLRYYPMVQQMRRMREAGDLGEILVVQGTYSQDWLLYDTDWNWRVETEAGGPSRCMADIGSHWFDMAEHVTGSASHVSLRRFANVP